MLNLRFCICFIFLLISSSINYNSLYNYYKDNNQEIIKEENIEEKFKKEILKFKKNNSTVHPKIELNSLSALLMDGENNRVLYEVNGYQEMPMASTTKIMTCIIALEAGNLNDVVTVSSYAAGMPDVQLHIKAGNSII